MSMARECSNGPPPVAAICSDHQIAVSKGVFNRFLKEYDTALAFWAILMDDNVNKNL